MANVPLISMFELKKALIRYEEIATGRGLSLNLFMIFTRSTFGKKQVVFI
jgi:hypothetical protein